MAWKVLTFVEGISAFADEYCDPLMFSDKPCFVRRTTDPTLGQVIQIVGPDSFIHQLETYVLFDSEYPKVSYSIVDFDPKNFPESIE